MGIREFFTDMTSVTATSECLEDGAEMAELLHNPIRPEEMPELVELAYKLALDLKLNYDGTPE